MQGQGRVLEAGELARALAQRGVEEATDATRADGVEAADAATAVKAPFPTLRLRGELLTYSPGLSAFCCDGGARGTLVLVGGLTDAPPPTPYAPLLAHALAAVGWRLVMPWLSSSGVGWGIGSIAADARELVALVKRLKSENAAPLVVMGHSTGSQDCVAVRPLPPRDRQENAGLVCA